MALMTPVEKKEREYLKSYGAEREREQWFPRITHKENSVRKRKKERKRIQSLEYRNKY